LPVTLFEAFDLWQEAYLTRLSLGAEEPRKTPHPLLVNQRFENYFITEPHAELNAGFVALFASSPPAIFDFSGTSRLTI